MTTNNEDKKPKLAALKAELQNIEHASMRTQQRIAADRAEFREQLIRTKEIVKEIEAIEAESESESEVKGPRGQEKETKL